MTTHSIHLRQVALTTSTVQYRNWTQLTQAQFYTRANCMHQQGPDIFIDVKFHYQSSNLIIWVATFDWNGPY